jgi:pseudouridine 5'-phosphatase
MMGVPGSSNGEVFHAWADLPISREQYRQEQSAEQERLFPTCAPLPGARKLLENLKTSGVHIAIASSSTKRNFELKTELPETRSLTELFPERLRILVDNPLMNGRKGKPAPDIFLVALEAINESLPDDEKRIAPEECLVFEDSVPGVESGLRAGMRVVWIPHEFLVLEFGNRELEVLTGQTELIPVEGEKLLIDSVHGWAEKIESLELFDFQKFGINVETTGPSKLA